MSIITDQLDTLVVEVAEHGKTTTAGKMLHHLRTLIYAQERALQLAIRENTEKCEHLEMLGESNRRGGEEIERLRRTLTEARQYIQVNWQGQYPGVLIADIDRTLSHDETPQEQPNHP